MTTPCDPPLREEEETPFDPVAAGVLDSLYDGICLLDAHWGIRYANPPAAAGLGLPPAAVPGLPLLEACPALAGTDLQACLQAVMVSRQTHTVELPAPFAPDRWHMWRITPWQDGLLVALSDITAHKQAGDELRELNQRLTHHIDCSPLAVIEWGPDMRLIRWSGEAERMFGWAAEEVLGKRMEDFRWIYSGDEARVADVSRDLRTGSNPRRFSANRNYRKDGTIIDCEWYNSSLLDDRKNLRSILSLVLDVTERTRAEEALDRAYTQNQQIIDSTPDVIYAFDADGRFILANAAVARVLNATLEQLIGRRRHDFMPADDANWHEAHDGQVFEAGTMLEFEEYSHLADRTITWLTKKFPLRDAQGRIYAVAGISADISARKRHEQTLLEDDRAKDEFLAVLSHELQTPLTAMLGWSTEALLTRAPALMEQAMEVVHRNAVRQKRLVDDLLEMSRLTHGKVVLTCERIDMQAQARQAVANIRHQLDETGISCVVEPSPAPLPILADPARLQQCLGNLLGNSVKFTPPGGAITVRCWREGGHVACCVADTGRGIAPEALETIFQVFRQADRCERYGGLGLGLAITHGIVALHGGTLAAASDGPDRGSRFTLTLPLADAEE